jgi:hypothetical protein
MLRDIIFWKNINIYFKLKSDFKSLNCIELIKFYFIKLSINLILESIINTENSV